MNFWKKVRRKLISFPLFAKLLFAPYYQVRASRPIVSFINRKARALYLNHAHKLESIEQRIVEDFKRDGIAFTSLEELFPGKPLLTELQSSVTRTLAKATVGRKKAFLMYLSGERPTIDLQDPLIQLSLDEKILAVMSGYLGLLPKFKFFSVAKTIPVPRGASAIGSQQWHRDPGIHRLGKMFIYLNDVDETAGPFTYVKGSHLSGRWGHLFPQAFSGREGCYPESELVAKHIPKEETLLAIGKAGTVIFCDTLGIHKGGYATDRERIMTTSLYEAPSAFGGAKFLYPKQFEELRETLGENARYALS